MNYLFGRREHVFDRISKLGSPQIDATLAMLDVGFGSQKLARSSPVANAVFVLLYAALTSYLKTGLHCKGHRQNGIIEFKYMVELWLNTVMYQKTGPTVVDDAIKIFGDQKWHDIDPACFLDHLYEVLISDNNLSRLVTTTPFQTNVKKALSKVTTNLFAEHNIPLTIVAAAEKVRAPREKAPKVKKVAAPKASKAPKEPKAPKVASKASKVSSKASSKVSSKASKEPKASKASKSSKTSSKASSALTVEQLKAKAAECNIKGRSKMRKEELINAIKSC